MGQDPGETFYESIYKTQREMNKNNFSVELTHRQVIMDKNWKEGKRKGPLREKKWSERP